MSENADTATADTAESADALRRRAEQAERQRDEYLELVRRTQAEYENSMKRARRERDEDRQYAQGPLALDFLPALDNLERALAAARSTGDNGPLVQGVAATFAQLLDALKRHGVVRIEAAPGSPFDPNRHQAVMQQPSAEHAPDSVLQVLQHGFLYHDRVLRPASVIVSTRPE
jgi:molecular chaperone GrpE